MSDFTALLALIHVAHMRLGSSFAVTIAPLKRGPKKGTCEPQNRNNVVKPSQVFTAKLEKGAREARGGKFYTTLLQTAQFPGDMACSRSPLQIMAQRLLQERQHSPKMNYSPPGRSRRASSSPLGTASAQHTLALHCCCLGLQASELLQKTSNVALSQTSVPTASTTPTRPM